MSLVAPDPAGHLSLVQDLLSPAATQLPSSTPTAVSVQLATLPIASDSLTSFVRILLSSPSLWRGLSSTPPLGRSQDIFTAIQKGLLLRIDNIREEYGYGWRARRHLGHVLDAMLGGLDEDIAPGYRLLFVSAALAALHSVKARHDELYVGGSNLMGQLEDHTLVIWEEILLQSGDKAISTDSSVLPCWLAARAISGIDSAKLARLPLNAFINVFLDAIADCFADGRLFDHMDEDCSQTDEGLNWRDPSPSRTLLRSLHERPLFGELGRLSQIVGKIIESVVTAEALIDVQEHLTKLERLAERVNKGWLALRWSGVNDQSELVQPLRESADSRLPWTILKTLLFSLTMIHSSLISLLTSAPADEPAALTLDLCASSIRTFSWLYFVTSRFGSDGFGAYRGVWYGALDLTNRASDSSQIENLARNVEPKNAKGEIYAVTYYLNVVEQMVENLPDTYLEDSALRTAQRYLERAKDRDAFEAAHSVVLAIYSKGKRCSDSLAPWYTSLLLRLFPEHLSAPQLRLAYSTVVKQCSESSDPLAWLCVQKLLDAIEAVAPTDEGGRSSAGRADLSTLAEPPRADKDVRRSEGSPQDEDELLDESPLLEARMTALEAKALALPRGALMLVLIDVLGSLNLTLLLPALQAIQQLLVAEPAGEPKMALTRCLLAQLANQDAAKRVGAVRWWQEHSVDLWSGAVGLPAINEDAGELQDSLASPDLGEQIGQRRLPDVLSKSPRTSSEASAR